MTMFPLQRHRTGQYSFVAFSDLLSWNYWALSSDVVAQTTNLLLPNASTSNSTRKLMKGFSISYVIIELKSPTSAINTNKNTRWLLHQHKLTALPDVQHVFLSSTDAGMVYAQEQQN